MATTSYKLANKNMSKSLRPKQKLDMSVLIDD